MSLKQQLQEYLGINLLQQDLLNLKTQLDTQTVTVDTLQKRDVPSEDTAEDNVPLPFDVSVTYDPHLGRW